jgi:putative PEP-CTERM system histidine kinase
MASSPGGLLLLADDKRLLTPAARWNWRHRNEPSGDAGPELAQFLESSSYVIDFGALGDGVLTRRDGSARVPAWLRQSGDAWAGIPLVHNDRLVGLVILDHPVPRREMDWEDYDLFRTAGIQAASYIAEAQSQEALANAQRFDEFNRRFAFIMHDIKNLVSQLSLVARNAERHAGNPAFRADMVATLQSSVRKMNELLARLSRGNGLEAEAQTPRPVPVQPIVAAVAEAKRRHHPVQVIGDARLMVTADPARLEQALSHLVQNAIDASAAEAPVRIAFAAKGTEIAIDVVDSGHGMSSDFVRTRLFQPFASTKENGFGVGAFETRTLIAAMGGRIDVASREGEGSCFTIFLPAGGAETAAPDDQPQTQRMRA